MIPALLALFAIGDGNLLDHRAPMQSSGVRFADRLTDGVACHPGDPWLSTLTAPFHSTDSFVSWDLGAPTPIDAVWLQGDANDDYELAVSDDAKTWRPIWTAARAAGGGMQERHRADLRASGRYLRIRPAQGDSAFSLSEVQVFARKPDPFPPHVAVHNGGSLDEWLHSGLLVLGLALVAFVMLACRGMRWWWLAALAVLPLVALGHVWDMIGAAWPFEPRSVSLVRAIVAAVAAAAVLREAFAPRRFAAHRGAVLAVLAICGGLGPLCFYNLGEPQFTDASRNEKTFVHFLDLRQYYLTAKYFHELGYRHLYEADVAAYLEDHPEVPFQSIAKLPMRNLTTHALGTIVDNYAGIQQVKERFTARRWEALKADERYFRDVMGTQQYLSYLVDYGGNATPVWLGMARLLFSRAPASTRWFGWTALLDPLLLLVAFVAVGRAFGWRTMLVSMVVFGTNDYIMYGSNWAGATLRHDWLAYLALGAACLRRERWLLGGAFLALATLIRAFPALALVGVALPWAWEIGTQMWRTRRLPSLAELRNRPLERTLLGAAVTIAVLFFLGSFADWGDWLAKVHLLNKQPHGNHISLRGVIGGTDGNAARVLTARWPLFVAAAGAYIIAVVVACRGKRLEQAAILGLMLMPVVFAPANYYIHFIFLLPLLARETRDGVDPAGARIWLIVLGLCAVQYWTVWVTDLVIHFALASVLLFAALGWILLVILRDQFGWQVNVPVEPLSQK